MLNNDNSRNYSWGKPDRPNFSKGKEDLIAGGIALGSTLGGGVIGGLAGGYVGGPQGFEVGMYLGGIGLGLLAVTVVNPFIFQNECRE